jgi:hypothetical protein
MSAYSNQTNVSPGTALFNPLVASGIFFWPAGASATAAVTVPGVTATSVVLATVDIDDQQGAGTCWIISSTPTANTITFTLAAASSAASTLRISWMVAKY